MKTQQIMRKKIYVGAWCCVVFSLLFSVGEGLQLAPFTSLSVELSSTQFGVSPNYNVAFFEHGPIDIPTQFRKRNKRDFNDLELPSNPVSEKLTFRKISPTDFPEIGFRQAFKGQASGRAPPTN
jgi:hypothetical protein